MEIWEARSADLSELNVGPYPFNDDMIDGVRWLKREVALAVRSFIGMTITLTIDGQSVTWTSIADWVQASDVRSSLEISLANTSNEPVAGVVTFYGEKSGAFKEMADLFFLPATWEKQPRLDQALKPNLNSGVTGLQELTNISRAVGILIARGHTPQSGLEYLRRSAPTPADLNQAALDLLVVCR